VKKLIFLGFVFCFGSLMVQAETWTVASVPNTRLQDASVCTSDPDDLIDPASQAEIDRLLFQAEQQLSAEVFVVALTSTGDVEVKQFATALFNEWHIGKKENDNGLLILMVEDQGKVTFETGYGMEGILPDAICSRIIRNDMVPFMKTGKYGEGLLSGVKATLKVLSDPNAAAEIKADVVAEKAAQSAKQRATLLHILIIYLLLSLVVLVLSMRSARRRIKMTAAMDPYAAYKALNTSKAGYNALAFIFPLTMVVFTLFYGKKVKNLRRKPRLCPTCGKSLSLMNEQQEDAYLNAGQQSEETVGSVDYDAWVCMDCGYKSFLSYTKYYTKYKNCPACGFKTYAQTADHIVAAPTPLSSGEGMRIYSCANCGHVVRKSYVIPMIVVLPTKGGGSGGFGGGDFGGGGFGGGMSGGGGATGGWK
jgi:uncharacterized protein